MKATALQDLMTVTDVSQREQVYQAWRTALQLESLALVHFLQHPSTRFQLWYYQNRLTWTFNGEDITWVGFIGELLEVLQASADRRLLTAPTGLVNRAEHGDYFDAQFWALVDLLTADGFGLRLEEYPQGRQLTLGFLDEG